MSRQLEPGERLSDPDLTKWLGMSRTPIREALSRLAEQGLVEIEANKLTRVAHQSSEIFGHAHRFLRGLHLEALRATSDSPAAAGTLEQLSALGEEISRGDNAALCAAWDLVGDRLVPLLNNPLFMETEMNTRLLAKFHLPDDSGLVEWPGASARVTELA